MLYCDRLTWASVWAVLWVAWRYRLPLHLKIFGWAESALTLINLLRWCGWQVTPCEFVYGELQDDDGMWLYARVMRDLNTLAGQVVANRVGAREWFQHAEQVLGAGKLRLIFVRRVHALLQLPLLQTHLAHCLSRPQKVFVILGSTMANTELRGMVKPLSATLFFYWHMPPLLQQWTALALRRLVPGRVGTSQHAAATSQVQPIIYYPPSPPPMGVLLTHDIAELTVDHSVRSFPHWLPSRRVPPLPTSTYVLKRTDLPVTHAAYEDLLAAGAQVVTLQFDPQSPYVPVLSPPPIRLNERLQLYRELFPARFALNYLRQPFWASWVWWLVEQTLKWERYLKLLHVKLYVTRQTWLYEGLECALFRLGGWALAYQYSNLSLPHPAIGSAAEVILVFAPYFMEFYKRLHSFPQFFVIGGYLYDRTQSLLKERALQVRRQLQSAGAQYIICVFDENWSDDSYSPVNRVDHVSFLRFFLEWLLVDATLGVAMKMQYTRNTPAYYEELRELYAEAQKTNRLYVYGEGHYTIRNLPVEAALTADLVVNHIYGATAGLESALAGVRVVLIDQHNYTLSLLAEWGGANIVFNSLQAIKTAIQNYRTSQPAAATLGDWSPFLSKLDPFRDGKASLRLDSLIQALLQAQAQNQPLALGLQAYSAQWGTATISPTPN